MSCADHDELTEGQKEAFEASFEEGYGKEEFDADRNSSGEKTPNP